MVGEYARGIVRPNLELVVSNPVAPLGEKKPELRIIPPNDWLNQEPIPHYLSAHVLLDDVAKEVQYRADDLGFDRFRDTYCLRSQTVDIFKNRLWFLRVPTEYANGLYYRYGFVDPHCNSKILKYIGPKISFAYQRPKGRIGQHLPIGFEISVNSSEGPVEKKFIIPRGPFAV